MAQPLKIGFLGAGKMASALAKGFVRAKLVGPSDLIACDPVPAARASFEQATGAHAVAENARVVQASDILVVAVKPEKVEEALVSISPLYSASHLLVSIAAGVSLDRLQDALPRGARIIRVMPNTPALVGASASAYALNPHATREDEKNVERLLSAVGCAVPVSEGLLDAVTGLSGSGPAFIYQVIEAMSDGGVAAGLPRDLATRLAAQTVLGSARMVLETGLHPGALKDMVASPAGTTIEGIHELEKGGVRASFINAVVAAARKSRKLGRGHKVRGMFRHTR